MRPLLFVLLSIFFIKTFGQREQVKLFKKTEYVHGIFCSQTTETIKVPSKHIDIYFFNKHFFLPYNLPEKFEDERHKNQTISVLADPKGKIDYENNWEKTYTFDNLGRVTKFTYSGCARCSDLPYSYAVTYNSAGQVERIIEASKEKFKFYYNNEGDIMKFEKYFSDQLQVKIELLN